MRLELKSLKSDLTFASISLSFTTSVLGLVEQVSSLLGYTNADQDVVLYCLLLK
jgi:hypothetical protein